MEETPQDTTELRHQRMEQANQELTLNFAATDDQEVRATQEEEFIRKKTSLWPLLFMILIIGGLGFGGYSWFRWYKSLFPLLPPASAVPANWLTFHPALSRYTVRYPDTWLTKEGSLFTVITSGDQGQAIVIYVNRGGQSFFDEYTANAKVDSGVKILKHQTVTVDGVQADQTEVDSYAVKNSSDRYYIVDTDIRINSATYNITMNAKEDALLPDAQQVYATLVGSFTAP